MTSLFILIGIIILFALAVFVWNKVQRKRGITEEAVQQARPDGCCGAHAVCEHTEEELKEKPVYFDDEELDRFARVPSHEYGDDDAEEFREIFYSIYDEEKNTWLKSLRTRHISLPNQVKQEILLIMKKINKEHQIA